MQTPKKSTDENPTLLLPLIVIEHVAVETWDIDQCQTTDNL